MLSGNWQREPGIAGCEYKQMRIHPQFENDMSYEEVYFWRFFDKLSAEADALFAALQQASEGGGEVDVDQRSPDPLPGILEAVLVQAMACQPPFWLFFNKKNSAGARLGE